jgi:hypothetical protein
MNQTPATATTTVSSKGLDEFLAKVRGPAKGRLIFGMDATASRQETWDAAAQLMAEMFQAAPSGLETQLLYFRGAGECHASRWFKDAKAMTQTMTGIFCRSGLTQIRKVLLHAAKEHAKQKIGAVILVSDACEEHPNELYAAARELGVPVFMFQEGDDEYIASVYSKIAAITKGAYCKFDSGAAARLADLLRAVAAFASGGLKALESQSSAAARLLLTQIKK